ncbi:MAG: hypothetical protein AB1730_15905 [Myxococcota bacterium]
MRPVLFAFLTSLAAGVLAGCSGPPAPDAVLCRDIITRLCLGPVCANTRLALNVPEDGCEVELLQRTGCGADEFGFTTPDRARALQCRRPLIRVSTSTSVKAPCPDVDEFFSTCPDMRDFLNGAKP